MKLAHPQLTQPIEWAETEILVLVFEHVQDFRSYASELHEQVKGHIDDGFVLSQRCDILDLHKTCQFIFDPFLLTISDKSVQQAVLKHMERLAHEENQLTLDMMTHIQEYIQALCDQALVPLHFSEEIALTGLMKLCGVQIDVDGDSLLERLMAYMQALYRLGVCRIFIFAHLKSLLTAEELGELYDFAVQEKMTLILVEHTMKKRLAREKYFIVDQDHCELSD